MTLPNAPGGACLEQRLYALAMEEADLSNLDRAIAERRHRKPRSESRRSRPHLGGRAARSSGAWPHCSTMDPAAPAEDVGGRPSAA